MYSHDTHYGWLIPPPSHYTALPVGGVGVGAGAPSGMLSINEGAIHPSAATSTAMTTTFDRYGRAVSNRSIGSNNRATPYSRHRGASTSGSNGSGGNPSPPQPPSAPQTPTSFHHAAGSNGAGSIPFYGNSSAAIFPGSSYSSQAGYSLPLDPSLNSSMYAYSGSWQNTGGYWPPASIPTAVPVNSSRSLCKYSSNFDSFHFIENLIN